MGEIKKGDIWVVNLDPTIGSEIKKSRPSVIIQNDIGNKYGPITIIAPITSQNVDKIYPVEVLLKNINGLEKESKVLLNQIRAIDKKRLVKRIAILNESLISKVDDAIKISLDLR